MKRLTNHENEMLDLFVELRTCLGPTAIRMAPFADRAIDLMRNAIAATLKNMACSVCGRSMQFVTIAGCKTCKDLRRIMRKVEPQSLTAVAGGEN